jgi:hypothetical protein
MSELRQDPITHDWVIINPERAKRPEDTSSRHSLRPFCDQVHRLASHWFIDVLPRLTTPAGFELADLADVGLEEQVIGAI